MVIGAKSISFSHTLLLLGIVVVGMILAGIVVIVSRAYLSGGTGSDEAGGSVIRSWIAISLVMGLLIFCAAAFLVEETSLRSTLFGGLIASVSAAVAFYFSSKSADQARADILKAAVAMSQGNVAPTGFVAASPGAGKIGEPYRRPNTSSPAAICLRAWCSRRTESSKASRRLPANTSSRFAPRTWRAPTRPLSCPSRSPERPAPLRDRHHPCASPSGPASQTYPAGIG
jgi:hypothetical protein